MQTIAHVTTGLNQGGAERVLYNVVTSPKLAGFRHVVISLLKGGPLSGELLAAGVEVVELGMEQGSWRVGGLLKGAVRLGQLKPAIIQGWMYHGNLAASLFGAIARAPVIWGIHHTAVSSNSGSVQGRCAIAAGRPFSRLSPKRIVYCSDSALQAHLAFGYGSDGIVIRNGIDTSAFRPSEEARWRLRQELGLAPEAFVVGSVGRYDPLKDYGTFIRAAADMVERVSGPVRFVLCGRGLDWDNPGLVNRLSGAGLREKFILLGPRSNVASLLPCLDVFSLSSASEALPLALLEAMAAGVPCVVTDVGDCASVLGRAECVVPMGDPAALAAAWHRLYTLSGSDRAALGASMRRTVIDTCSVEKMAAGYHALYATCANGSRN